MTDGFYRLVDVYGLMTLEQLARRCRIEGVATLMRELRGFEQEKAQQPAPGGAQALKSADDASALLWQGMPAARTAQAAHADAQA
ncbi:hypothetical protein [Massilia sp. Se16.2.3]|nr:hypothetical protein [Massilia sp. Se16.2.3]QNA98721.1 hypothetical protein G4G31_07615 [Massilia sp. Se16.2.3]